MNRTDHHAPSSPDFDPQHYVPLGVVTWGEPVPAHVRDTLAQYRTAGYRMQDHESGESWRCVHCGSRLTHAAIMARTDTQELVRVGGTCLDRRFAHTLQEFRDAQKRAAELRKQRRIVTAIQRTVTDHPLLAELTYGIQSPTVADNDFLLSISSKFLRYGGLSERQISAAERTIQRSINYVASVERRKRQDAARAESYVSKGFTYPTGRQCVSGSVASVRTVYSDYGSTVKALIIDDRGFKVWTTVPRSIATDVAKGDRVSLTVTLKVSDKDPLFGYGSRPTKAKII